MKISYSSERASRIPLKIEKSYLYCLVDSRSSRTLMNVNGFRQIPNFKNIIQNVNKTFLVGVQGNPLNTFGTANLEINFERKLIRQDFILTLQIGEDVLIGMIGY